MKKRLTGVRKRLRFMRNILNGKFKLNTYRFRPKAPHNTSTYLIEMNSKDRFCEDEYIYVGGSMKGIILNNALDLDIILDEDTNDQTKMSANFECYIRNF